MRAVLHQDLIALAGCLLRIPPPERPSFANLQIKLADAADRYRARTGRVHPIFGNGTLASSCVRVPNAAERRLDDTDYADCMIKALEAIVAFRRKQRVSMS